MEANNAKEPKPSGDASSMTNADQNMDGDNCKIKRGNSIDGFSKNNILDNAMRELLEFCEQYNENVEQDNSHTIFNHTCNPIANHDGQKLSNGKQCDKFKAMVVPASRECQNNVKNEFTRSTKPVNTNEDETIEGLREKQSKLQFELDELLRQADSLEKRQNQQLEKEFDHDTGIEMSKTEDNEEDELVEFQLIENKLRVSDLNRQLSLIQEKVRLKLYKRLISNTTNSSRPPTNDKQEAQNDRRGSGQTDELTPPSSAFSDEFAISSNSNSEIHALNAPSTNGYPIQCSQINQNIERQSSTSARPQNRLNELDGLKLDSPSQRQTSLGDDVGKTDTLVNCNRSEAESSSHSIRENRDASRLSVSVSNSDTKSTTGDGNVIGLITSSVVGSTYASSGFYSLSPTGFRGHVNCDLECIKEDEEDCQDTLYQPDHIRTVFQEKISPILEGVRAQKTNWDSSDQGDGEKLLHQTSAQMSQTDDKKDSAGRLNAKDSSLTDEGYFLPVKQSVLQATSNHIAQGNDILLACSSGATISKYSNNDDKQNRPLTLYLPKPDEKIDLAEHIQALGHDLNLVSSDLTLTATRAAGYLRKNSSNGRRWLKRYFCLDRESKYLYYCNSETDLVKKKIYNPKKSITFSEIIDVYVDHKSSVRNVEKTSKIKNYVFVLVTKGRNYRLATGKAETMRAWIDVLFTATKADSYLEQLNDLDDGKK